MFECAFFICVFSLYVEYGTEKDLLKSLENGSVDKIWLFECNPTANFPLMVVKVHDEEPVIGVQITTPAKTGDGRNFSDWVYKNYLLKEEAGDHNGYDAEYCEYLLTVAQDQYTRMVEAQCLDVRNFHFQFYFRHQLQFCVEFSDTKTPILNKLNRKKSAKIEISTLKFFLTISSPLSVLCM